MKNQISVFEFGNEYQCQQYFNDDLDNGIEVFLNQNRLGSIIGLDIPDIDDEDATEYFNNEVINWILDNNF